MMTASGRIAMLRAGLIATTCLAGAAFGATQPQPADGATAVTNAPPPAPAPTTAAADASGQIGEIVVTAQRRRERLQDVPLSVTAISGDQLRAQDITDATRLEQIAPGLRLGRSGPAIRPAIRGVYTEAVGINADPRIGFYIDEIYQSRPQQGDAAFLDLERVEVQKGPQGTLFGRNSFGGNIALTTASPKDHVEGGIDLTGGNYNRGKVEAYYNQPIADGLAVRFAGEYERHDGYLKSAYGSQADLEDANFYTVRGSVRWTPPSLGGKLDVLVHASYFSETDHGYNNINAKVLGALVDTSLIRQPGQPLTVNGITYPFPGGYNGGNYATGVLLPYTTALRDNVADVGGADIGLPIPGAYGSVYDYPAHQRLRSQNYSGTISYDLTDWLRVRSITGYTDFSTVNVGDGDGGPVPISYYYNLTLAKTFTQEIQFQSHDKESPLQYTIGGYYLNDRDDDGGGTVYLRGYTTAGAAAQGLPVLYAGGSSCGFTYLPNTTNCAFGNSNSLNAADSPAPEHATTKSYAGYGQVAYTFDRKLTITGGIRYTSDQKTFQGVAQTSDFVSTYASTQNQAFLSANPNAAQSQLPYPTAASLPKTRPDGTPTGFISGAGYHAEFPLAGNSATFQNRTCGGLTGGPFASSGSNTVIGTVPDYLVTRCGAATFNFLTYRAAIDYKIRPDNLVYFGFSTGEHSGGFGGSFVPTTNPSGEFGSYGPEQVEAYELGTKNEFFHRKLQVNIAAFYNHYTKVQIQGLQFIPQAGQLGNTITTIYNGPTENAPGVDLEIVGRPTRALTLNFDANYIHARYDVYPQPVYFSGLCSITQAPGSPCLGFPRPTSPNYPNYIASQGGLGSGFFPNALTNPELFVPVKNNAGTIIGYQSLIYNKKTRVQNTPDIALHFGGSYALDLQNSGKLVLAVSTLFSGAYLLSPSTPLFEQHSYFKTDAQLTWESASHRYSGQVFVNNISNIATIGRATTSSLSASGTYGDPRTFGVKVGYHF